MIPQKSLYTLFLFLSFYFIHFGLLAQEVEHNYPMGPQNTTCDSLKLESSGNVEQTIHVLENTIFRFSQVFKLKRLYGMQYGKYYSCDGLTGYLVITYNKVKFVYREVPDALWKQLIASNDPDGLYLDKISGQFVLIDSHSD